MPSPMSGLSKFSNIEISHFFRSGFRAYKSANLDILSLPKKQGFARALPIISSKIANAPTRNLWKRRIRSLFYELDMIHHTFDYLIILKKPTLNISFQEFKGLFTAGMSKAHHNAIAHNFSIHIPSEPTATE